MPKKNNLISNNTEVIDNLSISHPHLASEWHPTKNGMLKPDEVTFKSVKRVWWKCPKAKDHEWEVRVTDRVKGPRCPFCIFYRLSESNSLLTLHPKLALEWHPTKNESLTPKDVVGTGNKKYWWKCSNNPTHEWQDSITARIRKDGTYRECQLCKATPLAITNPEIASQWHPVKNLPLTSMDVVAGSATYAWWKCEKGEDHEWRTKIVERLKTGCPFCDGKKLSITNSLEARYPELAKELHPTKNGNIKPCEVFGGGKKKYWWKCEKGPDHEWEATIQKRASGQGCSICRGLKVVSSNCVANTHSELIEQWHPTKNGNLTPFDVIAGSSEPIWWHCQVNSEHVWQTSCKNRTKPGKKSNLRGCPFCINQKVCKSNALATTSPDLAKEWHPTKNGSLTAYDLTEGSGVSVWWQCSQNKEHEWMATPANRKWGNNCPLCNNGWTIERVRLFVKSLLSHIDVLTPAELYVIFQQHGVSNNPSKARSFLQALKTGKFPKEELEKFVNNEKSLVDSFISDPTKSIDVEAEFQSEGSSNSISELEISVV